MKSRVVTLGILALCAVLGGGLVSAVYAQDLAKVSAIQGEVFVQTAGSAPEAWTPVTADTAIATGDVVKTGNGSCDLVYGDQATMHLNANTTLKVEDKPDTQDIALLGGKVDAKVDHAKTVKPFHFVTPTAVAAVRGTTVSLDFNAEGLLTVDLGDGNVLVYNDEAEMELDLKEGQKVAIYYDYATGAMSLKNDCVSSGDVSFLVKGKTYSLKPCDEVTTEPETAQGPTGYPETDDGEDDGETEVSPIR